ncbi:MAG: AAA family ATPase [Simkaniaceae bacterium]
MIKKLPIGIQSISKILKKSEYAYVDKTGFIKRLIDEGSPHFFLSRPRRFGKSLFINTLEEVFKGNRVLFKGLEIDKSNYDWQEYPILRFDFSQIDSSSNEALISNLKSEIKRMGKSFGVMIDESSVQFMLKVLIEKISEKNRVVILVDEYDKPIINNLKASKIAENNRDSLRDLFGTFKSLDEYVKFTFITGVSKFSQVSLFSGPNNLTDITMDPKYAGMMGYTDEELKENFQEHVQQVIKERGGSATEEDIYEEVRIWYNGYRFTEAEIRVYNPYSTLLYFDSGKAKSHWYRTGTPSFLIDQLKRYPKSIFSIRGAETIESTLSDISRITRINLAALMFQTGYLTIVGYNEKEGSYKLDFPNKEVEKAFLNSLVQDFAESDPLMVSRSVIGIKTCLNELNLKTFVDLMNNHFAKIPYHVYQHAKEGFYQAVLYTYIESCGLRTSAEIATSAGRIDLMTETSKFIYIFELKLDKTADIALTQSEVKRYKERYCDQEKQIVLAGLNFSSKEHRISDWKAILYAPSGEPIKDITL